MSETSAIEARGISKSFGHLEALRNAFLTVRAGEVLALVGDNGAGKSTLAKVLCGALPADRGEVSYWGESVKVQSVAHAQSLGVQTVYQDLALAPDLSVATNMFLGRELTRGRWVRVLASREMQAQTERALTELGVSLVSVRVAVRELSGGQRQALAVARALTWATTAVLMDEPTAALGTKQTAIVYDLVRTAATRGLAVLVISHDIPRVLAAADRVAVMRQGAVIASLEARRVTVNEVIGLMLGSKDLPE